MEALSKLNINASMRGVFLVSDTNNLRLKKHKFFGETYEGTHFWIFNFSGDSILC